MHHILIIIFLLTLPLYAQTNTSNLNWFAGADIVGTTGHSDSELASSFYVREFEISVNSSIDQTYDGILTLAYHQELEGEEEHLEVHEAFLFSSKLFANSNVKIGKFFLGFGRLNRFHRHDWIFTDAPYVQKVFFGNEGAKDSGVEYKTIFPSLSSSLTLGLVSGADFNHTHSHDEDEEHEASNAPTSYLRWSYFVENSTTKGHEIGLNLINRKDEEGFQNLYYGVDFIFKDRVGRYIEKMLQAEFWMKTTKEENDDHHQSGAYMYLEKGMDQHHALGLRLDYFKNEEHGTEHHHEAFDGIDVHEELKATSLSYIYSNSEFMKTRLTMEYMEGLKTDDDEEASAYRAFIQFVFNIGAHPAHVY